MASGTALSVCSLPRSGDQVIGSLKLQPESESLGEVVQMHAAGLAPELII